MPAPSEFDQSDCPDIVRRIAENIPVPNQSDFPLDISDLFQNRFREGRPKESDIGKLPDHEQLSAGPNVTNSGMENL